MLLEPDAPVERHQAVGRQPVAAVADLDRQLRSRARARMTIQPGRACGRDAVADGVLDERLQQQVRHQRVERLGIDLDRDAQPAAEPRLLDLEVLLQDVELVLERHLLRARRVERHAQQIAQLIDHHVGGVDVRCASARRSCSAC